MLANMWFLYLANLYASTVVKFTRGLIGILSLCIFGKVELGCNGFDLFEVWLPCVQYCVCTLVNGIFVLSVDILGWGLVLGQRFCFL